MAKKEPAEETTAEPRGLTPRTLPRWEELPDLDLYMDQVMALMERYLGAPASGKPLTSSMVNNYVKTGLVPAPEKKRYTRIHLACLLMVCALKPVLPLSSIQALLAPALEGDSPAAFYDRFCTLFEEAERTATSGLSPAAFTDKAGDAVLQAALNAQSHQAVALALSE